MESNQNREEAISSDERSGTQTTNTSKLLPMDLFNNMQVSKSDGEGGMDLESNFVSLKFF